MLFIIYQSNIAAVTICTEKCVYINRYTEKNTNDLLKTSKWYIKQIAVQDTKLDQLIRYDEIPVPLNETTT